MGWGEPKGPLVIEHGSLEERLFLALRQCATHSAGPLRAVADLYDYAQTARPGEVDELLARVVERVEAMSMPPDRRDTVERFLTVLRSAEL